ncbi:hypothetical protein ACIBO5_23530 [Nonomuraea angiospora]|nr:hypothetical protein [Nonomuraea angiospora]MDX3107297.1 hypothetical protein [Nonomuraea angiospora]
MRLAGALRELGGSDGDWVAIAALNSGGLQGEDERATFSRSLAAT